MAYAQSTCKYIREKNSSIYADLQFWYNLNVVQYFKKKKNSIRVQVRTPIKF